MRYLTVGEVIAFNRAEVGDDALADFGLLESAVLRPQTTIGGLDAYPSVHEKATALMHSLIRNHPLLTATSGPPSDPLSQTHFGHKNLLRIGKPLR